MTVYLRINIDQRNIRALRDLSRDFERRGWFENPRFHPYLAPLERDFSGKMRFAAEHEMAQMVAEAADEEPLIHRFYWGFHGLSFLYALRAGRAPEPVMRYCGATTGDYVLDARGHVHACWFGAGQDAFELGDISQVAAGLPFDARGRKRVARWRSRGVTRVEPCSTCKWALVCGGGCAFKSRAKTGDMMQPNCAPFTEIFDAVGKAVLEAPPEHWHDRGARSGPKGQLGIEVHTASRGLR
ncbi:MAG: SPASM domain-containing protein [Nannocystaceae bacterium]|nr:SPASM domain-containing protein [bacterium]